MVILKLFNPDAMQVAPSSVSQDFHPALVALAEAKGTFSVNSNGNLFSSSAASQASNEVNMNSNPSNGSMMSLDSSNRDNEHRTYLKLGQ
jgi:hypothetical protein